MAGTLDVESPADDLRTTGSTLAHSPSSSRLRAGPQYSDIHALASRDSGVAPLSKRQLLEPLPPPAPLRLDEAIARYAPLLPPTGEALQALQLGDLPRATTALLREIQRLNEELDAGREDFEALKAVNQAIEDSMDEALAVADDQRVQLLDDLERGRDYAIALENQLEEYTQRLDSAEIEITEMRAELVACQNRLVYLE